jgi:protein AaeX
MEVAMDVVMTDIPTCAIAAFLVESLVGDPSCAEKKDRGIDHVGPSLGILPALAAFACNRRGRAKTLTVVTAEHAMRFTEINLFGVYVAPISLMLIAAWIVAIALRWLAARSGLLRHVWHPALFVFAIYIIVLSSMVLFSAD